ncbi:hypothetical protein R1flu_021276, partial [Riccia fluitans]
DCSVLGLAPVLLRMDTYGPYRFLRWIKVASDEWNDDVCKIWTHQRSSSSRVWTKWHPQMDPNATYYAPPSDFLRRGREKSRLLFKPGKLAAS